MVRRRSVADDGSNDARATALPVLTALTVVLLVLAVALLAVVLLVSARRVLSAAGKRPTYGPEALIGAMGTVREPLAPIGQVFVDGSLWRARETWPETEAPQVAHGDRVVIERVDGLTLLVRRAETWEVEA